jgi:hypothetical protein
MVRASSDQESSASMHGDQPCFALQNTGTRQRGHWQDASATLGCAMVIVLVLLAGCGINKSRLATEQLVVSDAVDRTVASIDFSALSGKKVFFDTQYLDGVNLGPTGNIKYVISSLRQQMLAYDCRLQEKVDTADYVVEGRIGVLANDGHEVTYGVPGSAALASASVLLSSPVPIPALPELSLGRRNHQAGTAKIGLFAYDRATREPVWQAGVKKAASEARDAWILGLGPYQSKPSIGRKDSWRGKADSQAKADPAQDPLQAYNGAIVFERAVRRGPAPAEPKPAVATVSHEEPAPAPSEPKPIPLPKSGQPIPLSREATP